MNPIKTKITRLEKRGRKIIVVFESDLFSDETFCENIFYNEGDAKNQLRQVHFKLNVTEKSGNVTASVEFDSCLNHFTKGHSQCHQPLNTYFLNRKEASKSWMLNYKNPYYSDGRAMQVIEQYKSEPDFKKELEAIYQNGLHMLKVEKMKVAKDKYQQALKELNEALEQIN